MPEGVLQSWGGGGRQALHWVISFNESGTPPEVRDKHLSAAHSPLAICLCPRAPEMEPAGLPGPASGVSPAPPVSRTPGFPPQADATFCWRWLMVVYGVPYRPSPRPRVRLRLALLSLPPPVSVQRGHFL